LGAIPGPWPYVISKNQIAVSGGGRESAELVLATTQRSKFSPCASRIGPVWPPGPETEFAKESLRQGFCWSKVVLRQN
jgi:hypothetical protein